LQKLILRCYISTRYAALTRGQKLITHAARFGRVKIFQNRTACARCPARLTFLLQTIPNDN